MLRKRVNVDLLHSLTCIKQGGIASLPQGGWTPLQTSKHMRRQPSKIIINLLWLDDIIFLPIIVIEHL